MRRVLDFREQRAAAARVTSQAFGADLADGLDVDAAERVEDAVLHHQLKLICGRAMLHCLDGDHRIAYVLGEIVELSSDEAAQVLEIEPATFRKRLSRARATLTAFLGRHCGIADEANPCRCHRSVSSTRRSRSACGPRRSPRRRPESARRESLASPARGGFHEVKRVIMFYPTSPSSSASATS